MVGSRNLEFYDSFDEVHDKWKTTLRPQMFPPKPEERCKFNLSRWYVFHQCDGADVKFPGIYRMSLNGCLVLLSLNCNLYCT